MSASQRLLSAAARACNPFTPDAGTELMAPLLYGLVRMTRPRTIVEYGSGYTTLFLLAACVDNESDAADERVLLRQKTEESHDGDKWYAAGGRACGVDPAFYLTTHRPHLYCFERHDGDQAYVATLARLIDEAGASASFTYITGQRPSLDGVPAAARPIDVAWNDDDEYVKFFEMFWPSLNPAGGLMIFHNTAASERAWRTVQTLRTGEYAHQMEALTLAEPHKLWQNSCTILRRIDGYKPQFFECRKQRVLNDLLEFMELSDGDPAVGSTR